MKNRLKAQLIITARAITGRWGRWFVLLLGLGLILAFTLFRDTGYSVDQVAVAVAVPFIVAYAGIRLLTRYVISVDSEPPEAPPDSEKVTGWFVPVSVVAVVILLLGLVIAAISGGSSLAYLLFDLEWARAISNKVIIPALWTACGAFGLILTILSIFITRPYWLAMLRIVRVRYRMWRRTTQEFHFNGYRIPLHR